MKPILIFHILENTWLLFGAYWVGTSLFNRESSRNAIQSRTWLHAGFLGVTLLVLFLGRHRIPALLMVVLCVAWAALGLYWTTSANAAQSLEFRFYRWIRLLVLAVVFLLLFWNRTGIGVLGDNFLSSSVPVALIGFAAALAGLATAVWARIHLGRFWSDKVVLQSGHELIRTGPYVRMRHPIYSGVLLGVLGTACVIGEWRGLLAFVVLLLNYIIKAKKEEHLLAGQFGLGFAEHTRRAGFLLPRLRPLPDKSSLEST